MGLAGGICGVGVDDKNVVRTASGSGVGMDGMYEDGIYAVPTGVLVMLENCWLMKSAIVFKPVFRPAKKSV